MSVSASIRLDFSDKVLPSDLWRSLVLNGWGFDIDGSISLLCSGQDEWEVIATPTRSDVERWFRNIKSDRDMYGVVLVHESSGIGGTFLVDGGWQSLDWGVNINRPSISGLEEMTDFSLCLCILWPVVSSLQSQPVNFQCFQDM